MNFKTYISKGLNNFPGLSGLIISTFSFSLMTVCVKHLQGRIPIAELVFTRALISIVITRLMLLKKKINPWGNNRFLLLIRGLLGTFALVCIFKAIETLPLASATILQYTYPTFTSLAAWIFLKESINRNIILGLLIGWVGITLVAQPRWLKTGGLHLPVNYLCIAILGAIFTALAYICVRKLSKTEHPLVIIHYFPLISVPITFPLVLTKGVMPSGIEWFWLLGIGIFTQIGQIGITKGLTLLPASTATAFNYTQVIFATIWGVSIFGENLNKHSALGGILILASTLISITAKPKIT